MPAQKSFSYNLILYAVAYGPVVCYLTIALDASSLAAFSVFFTAFHIVAMRRYLRWARQQEARKARPFPNLYRQNSR